MNTKQEQKSKEYGNYDAQTKRYIAFMCKNVNSMMKDVLKTE